MSLPVNTIVCGDALTVLKSWPDESVHCVVTSPPYWGLRDYGVDGQMGLEGTPDEYLDRMTLLFDEVRRVLRNDGTLWLNMGDCYVASGRGGDTGRSTLQGSTESQDESKKARAGQRLGHGSSFRRDRAERQDAPHKSAPGRCIPPGRGRSAINASPPPCRSSLSSGASIYRATKARPCH